MGGARGDDKFGILADNVNNLDYEKTQLVDNMVAMMNIDIDNKETPYVQTTGDNNESHTDFFKLEPLITVGTTH